MRGFRKPFSVQECYCSTAGDRSKMPKHCRQRARSRQSTAARFQSARGRCMFGSAAHALLPFLDNSIRAAAHSAGKSKPTSTTSFRRNSNVKSGTATVRTFGLPVNLRQAKTCNSPRGPRDGAARVCERANAGWECFTELRSTTRLGHASRRSILRYPTNDRSVANSEPSPSEVEKDGDEDDGDDARDGGDDGELDEPARVVGEPWRGQSA